MLVLRLLGCWPAIPLCFTTGPAEEDRIASASTTDEDGKIAPLTKEDKHSLDKEREKDEEFRYMCEWLAKQKVPARSITYKCEKPQGTGAEWYVVQFDAPVEDMRDHNIKRTMDFRAYGKHHREIFGL